MEKQNFLRKPTVYILFILRKKICHINNLDLDKLCIPHSEFDKNNDGLLSFDEFCDWLNWF